MLSILNNPYPCIYGQKSNVITALCIGVFVAVFLLIFEPFGITESTDSYKILKTLGFGLVSFVTLMTFYFLVPRIFPNFFKEKNYTVGRELISCIGLILSVGLANGLYSEYVLNEQAMTSLLVMIWQTFLVGIFPLVFLCLLQYNRQLQVNLKASREIIIPKKQKLSEESDQQLLSIPGEKDQASIAVSKLLYIESDGNYAYLNQLKGSGINKTMIRTTLKSIEAENAYPNIFRCHRSYIVNLDHVSEVSGNAQGLKLTLREDTELVPVSKKYIPSFKKYFNKNNQL